MQELEEVGVPRALLCYDQVAGSWILLTLFHNGRLLYPTPRTREHSARRLNRERPVPFLPSNPRLRTTAPTQVHSQRASPLQRFRRHLRLPDIRYEPQRDDGATRPP